MVLRCQCRLWHTISLPATCADFAARRLACVAAKRAHGTLPQARGRILVGNARRIHQQGRLRSREELRSLNLDRVSTRAMPHWQPEARLDRVGRDQQPTPPCIASHLVERGRKQCSSVETNGANVPSHWVVRKALGGLPLAAREKIRKAMKGKKHSAETREKMAKTRKGQKRGKYVKSR